jgi:hypothetical protein
MSRLSYLADEICAGAEIYYTGRQGGQYLKTAFILCDDYTELASKLYLIEDDENWSDKKASGGGFKNYHQVLSDVRETAPMAPVATEVAALQSEMRTRRDRRNRFFHSAELLDLNITARMAVEAYCELFRYCELLFGTRWGPAAEGARNLATLMILFKLERAAFAKPEITGRSSEILNKWPRNATSGRKTGIHQAEYPEDLHLRLCVTFGGTQLRAQLEQLLGEC